MAADLGLSLSMIYKWAEPEEGAGSGMANPLDRIEALVAARPTTADCAMDLPARGRLLHPESQDPLMPHPDYLIPATNEIVQEFADLLSVIAFAAADNRITQKEAENIRARWEELKAVTESFVVCCEKGNFGRIEGKAGNRRRRRSESTAIEMVGSPADTDEIPGLLAQHLGKGDFIAGQRRRETRDARRDRRTSGQPAMRATARIGAQW